MCGFRKTQSMPHALFEFLSSWQISLNRGEFGSVLMDLSKAYDCLKDGLLLAKLQVYGFSKKV